MEMRRSTFILGVTGYFRELAQEQHIKFDSDDRLYSRYIIKQPDDRSCVPTAIAIHLNYTQQPTNIHQPQELIDLFKKRYPKYDWATPDGSHYMQWLVSEYSRVPHAGQLNRVGGVDALRQLVGQKNYPVLFKGDKKGHEHALVGLQMLDNNSLLFADPWEGYGVTENINKFYSELDINTWCFTSSPKQAALIRRIMGR